MAKVILGEILKRKRISKRRFAKMLEIDYKNVFRLFHEGADPKFSTLCKWAAILGVRVRDLIGDDLKPISSKPRDVAKKTRSNTSRNTG